MGSGASFRACVDDFSFATEIRAIERLVRQSDGPAIIPGWSAEDLVEPAARHRLDALASDATGQFPTFPPRASTCGACAIAVCVRFVSAIDMSAEKLALSEVASADSIIKANT